MSRAWARADFSPSCAARDLAVGPDGLRWVEARSVSYSDDVPYGLLSDLILACLGLPGRAISSATLEALEAHLRDLVGDDAAGHVAILGNLLSLPLPAAVADELAPLSPEALRMRYEATAEVVLRRISAERPIADRRRRHPLGGCVLRRGPGPAALARPRAEAPVRALRPTGSRDCRLAPRRGGPRDLWGGAGRARPGSARRRRQPVAGGQSLEIESLPSRARFIFERAEGNPFFVEEVIRMLIEREWVVLRDGRWVGSATIASAEVPPTLAGLLTARIDRLPVASRRILRVGAVIGRDIPTRLLEAVIGDPSAAARALGLAEAAGLVRIASVDPEPVYRFRHVLVQEAAYASLLKTDRRRLHREVGEAIEARGSRSTRGARADPGASFRARR